MAGDRRITTRQHRGHDLRVQAAARVADRVDAAVQAVQLPLAHPPPDRRVVEPARRELVEPDPPLLSLRDLGDPLVGCVEPSSRRRSFVAPFAAAAGRHGLSVLAPW